MEMSVLTSLLPGERAIGTRWVGPRAHLDVVVKNENASLAGDQTPAVLPVASDLTDWAIRVKQWGLWLHLLRGCHLHAMTPRLRALPRVR